MLRIIPRLDIKSDVLVKPIKLEGLRRVGDPIEASARYYADLADELFVHDPVASLYGTQNSFGVVDNISTGVFIPVCASGGIRHINDVYLAFERGADKIAINSILFSNIKLLDEIKNVFGSQSIVGSVEIKKVGTKKWEAYYNNGRESSGLDALEWMCRLQDFGVGELTITSIDCDGMKSGFDLDFLYSIGDKIDIPLLISGGLHSAEDIYKCLQVQDIDGVLIGSFLHYNHGTIISLKNELKEKYHVEVRQQ